MPLFGYTKVGDNTLPNLIPIPTGKYQQEQWNDSMLYYNHGFYDHLVQNFIWNDFSKKGFVTLLAEDEAEIATFNYAAHGFRRPPTDHYYRPVPIAMSWMNQIPKPRNGTGQRLCYGPKQKTEILLDWLQDFAKVYKNHKYFALAHLSKATHDFLNGMGTIADSFKIFFTKMHDGQYLNKTMVIFYSDHGYRMPVEYSESTPGLMERRAPFMYILLPAWFKLKYRNMFNALKINSRRLTSNFDIYKMLSNILNNAFHKSSNNGVGVSLLSPVPFDRSCKDAGIPKHWCLCQTLTSISSQSTLAKTAGSLLMSYINAAIFPARDKCFIYEASQVFDAKIFDETFSDVSDKIITFIMVAVQLQPGNVRFRGTVPVNLSNPSQIYNDFNLDTVETLDIHGPRAKCIFENHFSLNKFCLCRHL